jgi:hypothetical protein
MLKIHQCYGCKGEFPIQEELAYHQFAGIGRYGVAIPECLATLYDIIAKENELFGYPPAHRLIIDAYAAQHPRHPEVQQAFAIEQRLIKASVQSITVHLIGLYCAIELKIELPKIAQVMGAMLAQMKQQSFEFYDLQAPADLGSVKVMDVKSRLFAHACSSDEYLQLAMHWAKTVWDAWKEQHATIGKLYTIYGGRQ